MLWSGLGFGGFRVEWVYGLEGLWFRSVGRSVGFGEFSLIFRWPSLRGLPRLRAYACSKHSSKFR